MVHRRKRSRVFHQFVLKLKVRAESEERTKHVVCYRARDDTVGLDMEGRRESEGL